MIISRTTCDRAPVILLYGAEGRGKTSLACKFPNPVAVLLEHGLPRGVAVDAVEGISSYDGVLETLRELYTDPRGYRTLIIDTLDSLEGLLIESVCHKNSWKNIETPSYGKGYVIADLEWQRLIRGITALRDKHGMTVVMVAHSTIERIDDPRAPTYTSYLPKLHKRARHLILDACDIVGFLAEDLRVITDDGGFRERTRAAGTNARQLFLEGTPAFAAKNRFGMPAKMPIPLDFNIAELTAFWAKQKAEEHVHAA